MDTRRTEAILARTKVDNPPKIREAARIARIANKNTAKTIL